MKTTYVKRETVYHFGNDSYIWRGWYGCQLYSLEWRRVPAGTSRILQFENEQVRIIVESTKRMNLFNWFKVYTTWSVSHSGTMDQQRSRIEHLQRLLRNDCH